MSEIRMTTETRTDYECEVAGLPAERWAEAVFKLKESGEEEFVIEVSVEKAGIIVGILVGEVAWKGTLEGFKKLLKGELK
ncbi:MAG: hypothetical protein GXO17_01080 [Thermodesulfobacteria bacterium]|nr:hypothetical protein [Thermodesulfobacteriota bacterium]